MIFNSTKYLFRYPIGWYISFTISSALTCLLIYVLSTPDNTASFMGFAVFLPIVALSLFFIFRHKKTISNFESDLELCKEIDADFEDAISFRKNTVRFGKKWVYIKGSKNLLSYSDIIQVYQYIHKTNFIEDYRALKYVNPKGKHLILCYLKTRDHSKEEMIQMIEIIYKNNPGVKLGYR